MGRTGRFLACEHDGDVDPDIVVLAKTLSGGFVPSGAVLCKKWIHEKVFSSMNRSVVHSSTFSQGSFAMAAGLAALDVLDREQLIPHAEKMGRLLTEGLQAMVPRFEFLKEIRGRGLMIGIEFGPPKSLGLKAAWTLMHQMDKSLFPQAALIPLLDKHHILAQVAGHHIDVIKLIPPLVISEEDVKWFLTAFEDVLVQLHKFPGPAWDVVADIGKMMITNRAR
jgi:ornithine--oxo-acid transaminase